jgi:hypothetical protein
MYNLLSDCGLVDARTSASEKDLPVYPWVSIAIEAISNCCSKNLRYYRDYEQNKTNATSHHLFFCKLIIVFTLSPLCVTCIGNPKTSLEKRVEIVSEG